MKTKNWYESKTIAAAIAALINVGFAAAKLEASGEEAAAIAAAVLGLVATFFTIKGRRDAKTQIK